MGCTVGVALTLMMPALRCAVAVMAVTGAVLHVTLQCSHPMSRVQAVHAENKGGWRCSSGRSQQL